jgi:hypothetical protein
MNKQGWLTRSESTVGGEGQTQASLDGGRHRGSVSVPRPVAMPELAGSLAGDHR